MMDISDYEIKKNLVYAYKIIGKLGLDDHTYTHLSARSADKNHYYIFKFGLRFSEVEIHHLLKIDMNGNIIEGEEFNYNKTGYVIHSTIYKNRPDINSIFHLHSPYSVAISSLKIGLTPSSQWALHFYGKISYHNYNSLALDENEHGKKLVQDLKDNYVMLLKNHGSLMCGRTIHESMFYTHHLELACKTQILAMSTGAEIEMPNEEICKKSVNDLLNFEKDLGRRDWDAWVRYIDK